MLFLNPYPFLSKGVGGERKKGLGDSSPNSVERIFVCVCAHQGTHTKIIPAH